MNPKGGHRALPKTKINFLVCGCVSLARDVHIRASWWTSWVSFKLWLLYHVQKCLRVRNKCQHSRNKLPQVYNKRPQIPWTSWNDWLVLITDQFRMFVELFRHHLRVHQVHHVGHPCLVGLLGHLVRPRECHEGLHYVPERAVG